MHRRQIIYTRSGNFEESTNLIKETLNEITNACTNGDVHLLKTVLNSVPSDQLGHYLNAMIADKQDFCKYVTPLMIASTHGHDSIVHFLLENYSHYCIVDAQSYFSQYDFDYGIDIEYFNKQTALWLAVKSKSLNVVRILVSLGNANVNQKADDSYLCSKQTPLHLACTKGQLDMVKYLVENGADLYHTDKNNSTSLMIASNRGHQGIVQYLLSLDDISNHLLNAVNKEGSTALHEAAGSGRWNIVKLLLEQYDAKIVKNNHGYTPLTEAGINHREDLVNYFIKNEKQSWFTISEVIDEFELIGSHHVIHRYQHQYQQDVFERAYHYLSWAMQLRYKDPKKPILKTNILSPIAAYEYCIECRTIEELISIRNNPNRMIIECLMIRERVGVRSELLDSLDCQAELLGYDPYSIFNYNTYIRGYEECQLALQLWLHAYHLSIKTQIRLDRSVYRLRNCARLMRELIDRKRTKEIPFNILMEVLQATGNEFIRNKNPALILDVEQKNASFPRLLWDFDDITENSGDKYLYIILNLLFVATKVSETRVCHFPCG